MTCMKNMQHLLTSSQIQFLILVVLAGPLLASSPDPPHRNTSFTRLPLNDVLFTEDVLMEVSARSRIECSQKCMETEGCVMCTFHSSPQGPPGHCRLHSQLKTASDGRQPTTGAKTLVRTRCDRGYVPKCDRCLKAVNKRVNYTTAIDDCISKQGRLVMVKTVAEVDCVWSFMKDSDFLYIGSSVNLRHRWSNHKSDCKLRKGHKCHVAQHFLDKQHPVDPQFTCLRIFAIEAVHKKENLGLDRTWMGADDLKKAGVFRWNDGTLLPDNSPLWASNYGDGEPDKDHPGSAHESSASNKYPCKVRGNWIFSLAATTTDSPVASSAFGFAVAGLHECLDD
ncbi:hypothetical protein ACOMHN_058496 [Nucella lapillus]